MDICCLIEPFTRTYLIANDHGQKINSCFREKKISSMVRGRLQSLDDIWFRRIDKLNVLDTKLILAFVSQTQL